MSRTFRRCSFLMITLMICWMRIHGDGQDDQCRFFQPPNNELSSTITDKNEEYLKNHIKDCQQCAQKCKDFIRSVGSSKPDLLMSVIEQNTSCPFKNNNCFECRRVCRKCLYEEFNNLCTSLCHGVCLPCQLSKNCTQILLFDGGFTGQIQSDCNNSNEKTICRDIYNRSTTFNNSTCILSFDTDEKDGTNKNCRYSDSGVWLLNNTQNISLQINITRNETVRPTAPICFVKRNHSCSWTKDTAANCSKSTERSSSDCEDVICVDPKTFCNSALYNKSCENGSNDDIIMLNDSSPTCHKCGNAFKPTGGEVKVNFTFPGPHSNTKDSYHDVMKNLTKTVLEAMGNKTSVSVSADNITGIFVKKEKKQELSPAYFMYSFPSEFNIIEDETQLPTFDKTFSVPKEAFEKASSLNASTLFASLFRFPSFPQDNYNSTLLNREVYSIDMGEVIANLTNTFNLTFRNINPNAGVPLCSSWDGQGAVPNWTTDGCNTSYADGAVTCSCQHLTFFAVLMSIPKDISTSDLNNLTYITSIGCGLSLFFITIALFMHFLLRKGRASISVHILINLFLALFLLNLSFLSNESVANSGNVVGCKLMAGVMHYSMLSSFTWFGLQALHLCLQLTQNTATIQHYVTKLSIAGWVPPALVVTVIFINQKYDKQDIVSNTGKNASMCWINDSTVHYVVNIGYYCAIFLFTLLTFVVMLRWLWLLRRKQPTIAISGKKSRPSDALTIMGLCCILGLSWGFAFFAYGPLQIPALYIFTILNSFQGFFLFIYYYKSSKLVGEAESPPETSSLASSATVVENPYAKHKQF